MIDYDQTEEGQREAREAAWERQNEDATESTAQEIIVKTLKRVRPIDTFCARSVFCFLSLGHEGACVLRSSAD